MAADNKTHRLWIISELYYPELTSTGYYITSIAESLAGEFEVRVLCGQPNYSARGKRASTSEERNGVAITRVGGLRLDKNVLPLRVLNMLSLSGMLLLKGLASFRSGDSVLVVTTPPLLPPVTALAALIRGAGYTLLVHDVYPEQLIATGILKKNSIFARSIDLLNRQVYKHAQRIIAVGRDMQYLLVKKTGGLDIPIVYIPNWGETDDITPQPRGQNELLEELKLKDKFVVLSAGNFGRPSDLETIVSAAEFLSDDPRVRFLFIGGGAKEAWLKLKAETIPNIIVLPPMPRNRQNVFLNACDVTIVSLVRGMKGAAVPSRMYNYMAAGKPVIAVCEQGSEVAKIIDEENIGAWIEPGDFEGLARSIREMGGSPGLRSSMGDRARAAAVNKYSADKVLPRYQDFLVGEK